jgi:putative Holliday junction resolvase
VGAAKGEVVLAFDFGIRRIGVAVGQTATRSASAEGVIPAHGEPDWDSLNRKVRDWVPGRLLVGIPYNMDGTETLLTARCRTFAEQLSQRFGLPVELVDERLTSAAASNELRDARREGQKTRRVSRADVDAHAARLILETWMREHDNKPESRT